MFLFSQIFSWDDIQYENYIYLKTHYEMYKNIIQISSVGHNSQSMVDRHPLEIKQKIIIFCEISNNYISQKNK